MPLEKAGASLTNASSTMYVHTNFASGVTGMRVLESNFFILTLNIGVLHILWGDWSSNSFWAGYLSVTEKATGKVISGLSANYSSLSFPRAYYQGARNSRESTFIVGGKSTYTVTVNKTLTSDNVRIIATNMLFLHYYRFGLKQSG